MWIRWDARWYHRIATEGYSFSSVDQSAVAFFPLYPVLIRALSQLQIHPFVAGILITVVSGFVALCLFYRWVEQLVPGLAGSALWLFLLWPFSFFLYGVVYSDALFLALVIGAFLALEQKRLALATLLGAFATATRPVAPALILSLVLRQLELRRASGEHISARDFMPLLASAGLLAYMGYQYVQFGTPLAFLETQAGWQQNPGLHVWLKLDFFRSELFAVRMPRAFFHAALAFFFLALAIPTWRRLSRAYAVYILAVLGIPLLSSTEFIGLGRYAMAAFPCFLTLALLLREHPRARITWLCASAILLVMMTSRFAVGRYVS
jgi:hypothetical protein